MQIEHSIAILYICTGTYTVFWKDFFDSFEEFFLPNTKKEYFVFTDAQNLYKEPECPRIHKIFQESLGWPDNTLKRFHMFSRIKDELRNFEYTAFVNANCLCVSPISEEEFLPKEENLFFTQHPGYYKVNRFFYTYERSKKSTAYIPYNKGSVYIAGGLNGGKTSSFIELIDTLKQNIDIDEQNGIVARWHDESHINRYILDRSDYKLLPPSFLYFEGWNFPFEAKILVREKSKWLNIADAKNKNTFNMIMTFTRRQIRKVLQLLGIL